MDVVVLVSAGFRVEVASLPDSVVNRTGSFSRLENRILELVASANDFSLAMIVDKRPTLRLAGGVGGCDGCNRRNEGTKLAGDAGVYNGFLCISGSRYTRL